MSNLIPALSRALRRDGVTGEYRLATDATATTSPNGSILFGIEYDAVDRTLTAANIETYEFYQGGLAGVLVATITITYTDATLEFIDTAVRT